MKRPYTDDSTGSGEESPLARRLAERSTKPGMIDVKAAETWYGRNAGCLPQRTPLLDRLKSRSRNSESLVMGNGRLVFSGADRHDPDEPPLVASGFFASHFLGPEIDAGASRQTAGTLPDTRTAGKASIPDSGPGRAAATRTEGLVQRSHSPGAIDINPVLRQYERIGEPAARKSVLIERLQSRVRSAGGGPQQNRTPIAVGRSAAEEVPGTMTDEMNRSQTSGAGQPRHDLPAAEAAVSQLARQTDAFAENTSRLPIQSGLSSKAPVADAAGDRTSGPSSSAALGPDRPSSVKGYRINRKKSSGKNAGFSSEASPSLMMFPNGTLPDSMRINRRALSKTEPQNRQEQNHADELIRKKTPEPENTTSAGQKKSRAASEPDKKDQALTAASVTARRDLSGKTVFLKALKKTARTEKQSEQRASDDCTDAPGAGRKSSTGPATRTVKTAAPEIRSARTSATMIVGRKAGEKEALKGHEPAMDQNGIENRGREQSKLPEELIQQSEQPTVKEAVTAAFDRGNTSSITVENGGDRKEKTTLFPPPAISKPAFTRISGALHRAVSRLSPEGTQTTETAAMRQQGGERPVNAEKSIKSISGFINSAAGSPELPSETTSSRKPAIVWRKTLDSVLVRKMSSSKPPEGKDDSFPPLSNGSPDRTVFRQASSDVSVSSPGPATGQKTDLDLELLAEQVSYLLSRRLAVEHERRGVGI